MCKLYSFTKNQQAIIAATRVMTDLTGNLPLLPGIFPDYEAPIVRNGAAGRELVKARWGMPSPAFALQGRKVRQGRDQHPQHSLAALAPVTGFGIPVRGAVHLVFRAD